MPLPIKDQRLEQIGAAQERTVGRRRPAQRHMVAAAGAGVAAIDQELLGAQPGEPRLFLGPPEKVNPVSASTRRGRA
jgi:hypothetical protein